MSKIFDTFMFFNELDLLEIRLNILDKYVDYFVISEATVTFSGKSKPLYFLENKERFKKFEHKIIHNIVDDTPSEFNNNVQHNEFYTNWNKSYPHKHNGRLLSKLTADCQSEVYQRDAIMKALLPYASDEDIILCSDLDEIPNPNVFNDLFEGLEHHELLHLNQSWYIYYLNNFCDLDWFGTRVCKFQYLKRHSVDLIRYPTEDRGAQIGGVIENAGWHFSFLGGAVKIKEKLESFAFKGNRSTWILHFVDKIFPNRIQKRIENNEDIFLTGRIFKIVEIDNSFPEYLVNNINNYRELLKE